MAIFETVLKSDLKKPVQVKQLSGNLFSGDNQGNKITVEVMDNGSPATLSGGVTGYVIREDNSTVVIQSGTLSANKASIILPEEAYNVVGRVSIVVKVGTTTVGACTAYVYRTSTDTLVDPTGTIPSLQELLAKISACEQATADANKIANLTVSAEAATGSTPDAVLTETGSGSSAHKHITFKLVKGDKGDTGNTGATPQLSIGTVQSGSSAEATIGGTTENPVLNLTLPKGDTGNTGSQGPIGVTPQFSIGTVTTLEPGEDASVSVDNTDPAHPVLSFSIPQGTDGDATIDDTAGLGDSTDTWSADKLTKEFDGKADVIEETISTPASVMSFPDGADGLPMALTVGIEPVQDLHGYDNPWPAGGGKNLLPMTLEKLKQINTAGTWSGDTWTYNGVSYQVNTDSDGNVISIKVTGSASGNSSFQLANNSVSEVANLNGKSLIYNGSPANGSASTYSLYGWRVTNNGESIRDSGEGVSFTGLNSLSVGFNFAIAIASGYSIPTGGLIFYPMIRLSTVSDSTFAPYSNICPISGWTGANVSRTGKNLLKSTGFVQGVLPWNGNNANAIGSNNKVITSEYICVKGLNTVTVKAWKGNFYRWYEVDKDKRFLSYLMNTPLEGDSYTFQLHEGCEYIRFSIGFDSTNVAPSGYGTDVYAQIEADSTATAYEPYKGEQYQITFPSSAGTVYGGTLTVNKDGSGSLVVDRTVHAFDGTENILLNSTAGKFKLANSFGWMRDSAGGQGISNMLKNGSSGDYSFALSDNLYFEWHECTDATAMKAKLAELYNANTPLVISYKVSSPTPISLTPGQVKTLLGVNNIFADCGSITEVRYPADTKLYIDKKFAELSAAITALGT